MAPMGCCGFLWKPMPKKKQGKLYLGTTGVGPCVAFCLFEFGSMVSLVSHFESTSLNDDLHNCYEVAVELALEFLGKVFYIAKDSYVGVKCWIVYGSGPDKSSFEIAENLKYAYQIIANYKEVDSELANQSTGGISQASTGTLILNTKLGKLYNVLGDPVAFKVTSKKRVKSFNDWTGKNQDCGVLWNLEVPFTLTDKYPCTTYQKGK